MIPVIDVFAGPGGLNEGFSQIRDAHGQKQFEILASFEMDKVACETLRIRESVRSLEKDSPDYARYLEFTTGSLGWSDLAKDDFSAHLAKAKTVVQELVLGEATRNESDEVIRKRLEGRLESDPWVLIGGPPCQAYSLVGRSRRKNDESFESDHKHFLYKEYLHILEAFKPHIFVMENVKGLLSSTNNGDGMFEKIMSDLRQPSVEVEYEIRSLVVSDEPSSLKPRDFIVRSEDFGIPQKRHRVILLGVRKDIAWKIPRRALQPAEAQVTVRDAIADLPVVTTSPTNRKPLADLNWDNELRQGLRLVRKKYPRKTHSSATLPTSQAAADRFDQWAKNRNDGKVAQHSPRQHMISDLVRYRLMAEIAQRTGVSPKFTELPKSLLPDHKNAKGKDVSFADRFRVQAWDTPATTVVSHISKDGHYYIHPDPRQNRSLTVREAARLQTFPDDYYFAGPRTQQFHQVGNAVPPLLANQIADLICQMVTDLKSKADL